MDGQEKALFPIAWRRTKQDLVLRACKRDCNGMAQVNRALLIWQSISRKTQRASGTTENGIRKLVN